MDPVKRVVFVHPSGLHQIMGTLDGFPKPPVTAEGFPCGDRIVPFASLYRVTARAAFYKEPMVPASYTFHEAQQ